MSEKKKCSKHPCHSKQNSNLNRAIGQLEGIKHMIDDRRYCNDIMLQLKSVQSAVRSIEMNILKTHIQNCLKEAFEIEDIEVRDQKIEELINLFKSK